MHALARRRIDLAHVNEVEDDALRQAGPHPVRWSRELDGHEADRHERLAGGAAGLCRPPQPGPSALGESVRPPEQPPAVAEAAVLGGPHHKLRRGRPEREGREDVALAIGDHRDPRRLGPDLRRPPGAVEPAPALLLGQRPRAPRRPAPSVARQEAGVHQSEDRAVALIHRQNRVQIKAAAALRGHDRRVLDRQNGPAGAARRRSRRRLAAISSTVTAGLRRKRVRRTLPGAGSPWRRLSPPSPSSGSTTPATAPQVKAASGLSPAAVGPDDLPLSEGSVARSSKARPNDRRNQTSPGARSPKRNVYAPERRMDGLRRQARPHGKLQGRLELRRKRGAPSPGRRSRADSTSPIRERWRASAFPRPLRPGALIERASAIPEGSGRPGPCSRPGGRAHGKDEEGRRPASGRAEPDLPRGALGPWPRDFGTCGGRPSPAANALSAFARTRVFHRDGRGRRQDAGERALLRAEPGRRRTLVRPLRAIGPAPRQPTAACATPGHRP